MIAMSAFLILAKKCNFGNQLYSLMCQPKNLIILMFLFMPALIFAQQEQIRFSKIDVADGLSHNQVNSIFKDNTGFTWFATLSGLNRFDGYQFKVFRHDPRDTTSVADDFITDIYELPNQRLYLETRGGPNIYNPETESFIRDVSSYLKTLHINARQIKDILKDKQGNFWFNAVEDGVFKYDVARAVTTQFRLNGKQNSPLAAVAIAALQLDLAGNIWVIHQDKTIEELDPQSGRLKRRLLDFRKNRKEDFQDFKLFVDRETDLWIYTLNIQQGIDYYSTATGKKRAIDKGAEGLNSNLINGVLQDAKGQIWIATDHGGINLLDKKDFRLKYLVNKEGDVKSIGQNSVISLYKDPSGIIWVGTFKKGVSFYHEKILKFPLYKHLPGERAGLTYDDVNRFAEDAAGNLWIGTNGGGLFYFDRKAARFKRYRHEPENVNSISNDIIVSLFIDRSRTLWIGTYFGGLDSFDGKVFKHYKHDDKNPVSLSDDRVWDILEDKKGRLWIATLSGGLDLLDRKTGVFTHHQAGGANGIRSNNVSCLIEDRSGNIWIGTSGGVDQMKSNGQFVHYENKPGLANSLINNIVYDIMEDSSGFIWIATRDGLSRLNPSSGKFRDFDAKDGLTEMATLKVVEDHQHNLWVSTSNGLFNIIRTQQAKGDFTYQFRKYDDHDGLQGIAFNANAGYKTKAGELLFGGANGFNIFQPGAIRNDNSRPEIVWSDLQLANRSIGIGEQVDGRMVLKKAVNLTKEIELKYNQNGFTIAFAALNFFNPRKIKYRYKLEGFDRHWQELQGDIRRATYTNIDPGNYTFKVVSTDVAGNWVNNEKSIRITILPPFWRTYFAYLLYVLATGGALLLIRHRGIQRIRREFSLEQERLQAKRVHDLDLLKIKFLTNVSHEFRTPLSLIITPLEKLIRQAGNAEKQQLQMIQRNGRRLLNLVNQLLDFRRMEVHELKLHPRSGDLILFIRELSLSFTDVADRKNISFSFQTDRPGLVTSFDHDKIERILFNLLSNAFKFTPEGGCVTVSLQTQYKNGQEAELRLEVRDTGIGIEKDKQEKIFDRFFQDDVPDSMVNQGSGIGLSITREFVKLHKGSIHVESVPGEGSAFILIFVFTEEQKQKQLPVANLQVSDTIPMQQQVVETATTATVADFAWKSKKPVLVLVEDNEDFRFYLKDNLKEYYQITEAANGKEGWQKILSVHPDLIVSDVSMPEMNGIDLCRKIKSDKRTAHLPVILLTALTTEDQQLTGLETGANDYMTKPFNFEILLSKIRNLLQQQALSKKTYQKQVDFKPAETEIESLDDKFIRQLSLHIEKHLADAAYSVDQLSADMNISRVGLYKKILPLTGKSPIEYIRSYRLQKSKPLLLKSQLTIAEVAYQVGFSNPKHFSKYFKQEFDILPSAYAAAKGKEV